MIKCFLRRRRAMVGGVPRWRRSPALGGARLEVSARTPRALRARSIDAVPHDLHLEPLTSLLRAPPASLAAQDAAERTDDRTALRDDQADQKNERGHLAERAVGVQAGGRGRAAACSCL